MQEPTPGRMIDAIERATRSRDEFLKLVEAPPEAEAALKGSAFLSPGVPMPVVPGWTLPREQVAKIPQNPMIGLMRQQNEQLAESRKVEQENLEYARRSAIASEAALAAALERAEKAEQQAEQAEREKAAARLAMRVSLYIAGASLVVAAWPFLERLF